MDVLIKICKKIKKGQVNFLLIAIILLINSSKVIANPQTSNFSEGFDFMSLIPLIFIFGIMYFLLIRPQQKKAKEHRNMLNNISKGDTIVTNGGIIGKIHQIQSENEVIVEISEGIKIRVVRSMIAQQINQD